MSKYPCHVVQDLLPNYIDGVCSKKTENVVKEHIGECRECKALYESMTGELLGIPSPLKGGEEGASDNVMVCSSEEEKKILQKVNDRFNRSTRKHKIISIAVCLAAVMLFLLTVLPIRQIPAEDIDIRIDRTELNFMWENDFEHLEAPFTADWPENTLFFFQDGKDIDDCRFMKGYSEKYPGVIFAIETDYLDGMDDAFYIESILIETDYAIKSYDVEYLNIDGKTFLHLKDARTTLLDKGDADISSSVTLFYVGDIEGEKVY